MLRRRGDHARRLSEHERRELQRRVAEGETFASAAAAVGCSTKSIQRLLARTGGLDQRARERSPLRLSPTDREELSRGLVAGHSLRQIAGRVERAASTLSRARLAPSLPNFEIRSRQSKSSMVIMWAEV